MKKYKIDPLLIILIVLVSLFITLTIGIGNKPFKNNELFNFNDSTYIDSTYIDSNIRN